MKTPFLANYKFPDQIYLTRFQYSLDWQFVQISLMKKSVSTYVVLFNKILMYCGKDVGQWRQAMSTQSVS